MIIILFLSVLLYLFSIVSSFLDIPIFDSFLTMLSQNTLIKSLPIQTIFFLLISLILILFILLIYSSFFTWMDVSVINKNILLRILIYLGAIIFSLFILAIFAASTYLFLKLFYHLLLSIIGFDDIALNLININSLKNAIHSLSKYNNYLQISNSDWDKIWESIINSNNPDILYLKNNIFNLYNSLINDLNSKNFFDLLNNLNNINPEDLSRLKEIFNSDDVLHNLNHIYARLENINMMLNNLRIKLGVSDFDTISKSLPLFSDNLGFKNFLSSIKELNIRGNVISNLVLDNNNKVLINTNIGILTYSYLTGLFVNSLDGLNNMISATMNLAIASNDISINLVISLISCMSLIALFAYLIHKLISGFVINCKRFIAQIFKHPERATTYEYTYYSYTYFTEWYGAIIKFVLSILFISFIDFLISIFIVLILKIMVINGLHFFDVLSHKNSILLNLSFGILTLISANLSSLIFNLLKEHNEKENAKKILREYRIAQRNRRDLSTQFNKRRHIDRDF